jgi:hypothetical protein
MAVPVRPPIWPQVQTHLAQSQATQVQAAGVRPGRNDARLSAQKAFFEAALAGKPAPAAAEAQPERAAPAATPLQAVRAAEAVEARAADRLPPPGSIVNILV